MEQTVKENPDVVNIVQYGQTYEKRVISLLKVKTSRDLKIEANTAFFLIARGGQLPWFVIKEV